MKEVKENLTGRPFKPFDVAIYILLAAIVALCFVLSASAKPSGASFEAYLGGRLVLRYYFETSSYEIFDESAVEKENDGFVIRSEKGFNKIAVVDGERDVRVVETDCGTSRECMKMSLKNGSVICAPHSLVIRYGDSVPEPKVG